MSPLNLLIDIGNSCIKWALHVDGRLCKCSGSSYQKEDPRPVFDAAWGELSPPRDIYTSNVAGAELASTLQAWSLHRWNTRPHYVTASRSLAGVVNSYQEETQLGSDRWLALIAAWKKYARALCVMDCGTTITVDVLDASGKHQGGLIFPGSRLMREALAHGTAALQVAASSPKPPTKAPTSMLGRSTAEAIASGQKHALIGTLQHILAELQHGYGQGLLFLLCGGDAPSLLPQLPGEFRPLELRHEPNLVLEGLAHISSTSGTSP